jgi:hypothetical protein
MAGPMSGARRASALAAAWTGALALLALECALAPVSGPGRAFLIWSLPALPLAALTWGWLSRLEARPLRLPRVAAALVTLGWLAVAMLIATRVGSEWALDGLILRDPARRYAGIAMRWIPGVWGAAVSLAGLGGALEARYRLTRGP